MNALPWPANTPALEAALAPAPGHSLGEGTTPYWECRWQRGSCHFVMLAVRQPWVYILTQTLVLQQNVGASAFCRLCPP